MMVSYTIECPACKKPFKTFYSLTKHLRERHEGESINKDATFKDSEGNATSLPQPRELLDEECQEGFKQWLGGLVERINSTLHPRLPGRWIKIDSHQVPKKYFEYLLGKLEPPVNSVREVRHSSQPSYQGKSRRISYKVYDLETFIAALEESTVVTLKSEVLFAGDKQCDTNVTSPLSAEEEILRAKQRVHKPQQNNRPSSKSTLVVGYGEGRATREIELIWWPDLYSETEHGQLVVRMFIEKCFF